MGIIESLLKLALGGIPGVPPLGLSVSTPLGSGFSQQRNIADCIAKIEQAQREALAMFPAELQPGGWYKTKCNFGLEHVGHAVGCTKFDGLNADQILAMASSDPEFREDTWDRGVKHALLGGLSFTGWPNPAGHGHVTSIAARPMELSPSWNTNVPIVCNVGKPSHQDFVLMSAAYLQEERPGIRCFLWRPE